jgi:hypothetical protein
MFPPQSRILLFCFKPITWCNFYWQTYSWLIDYLLFYVPLKNISLIWRRLYILRRNLFRNCYRITKKLVVSFNHIDDVLSINNHNFHDYVHLIYPDELEIKDTTESDKSSSYLDILLNIDSNGRLNTSLYMTNVMILTLQLSSFLFYVVTYHFHLLMVCTSPSWFDTQEHVVRMRTFQNEADY